jgi:hypothetical protein
MDVNALVYCGTDKAEVKLAQENCVQNVKRFLQWNKNWSDPATQNPYLIMDLSEIKTTWHPIENIGVGGAKY